MICRFVPHSIVREAAGLIDAEAVSEEKQSKTDINRLLDILTQFPRVVTGEELKLESTDLKKLEKNKNVLHASYSVHKQEKNFYLSVERISDALLYAKQQIKEHKDTSQFLLLSMMGVRYFSGREQIEIFTELENAVFFQELSWYDRIFRIILGKKKLHPVELIRLRKEHEEHKEKIISQIELIHLRKEHKEHKEHHEDKKEVINQINNSHQISHNEDVQSINDKTNTLNLQQDDVNVEQIDVIEEKEKIRLYLQKVVDILDEAWRNKEYPNRIYLLSKMPEFGNEDNMVYFLKKNGSGTVYSFFVKVDKPEFVWPILISQRYLRHDGKKTLIQIRSQMDQQSALGIPDQESYDILVHVESFLERILSKMKLV